MGNPLCSLSALCLAYPACGRQAQAGAMLLVQEPLTDGLNLPITRSPLLPIFTFHLTGPIFYG